MQFSATCTTSCPKQIILLHWQQVVYLRVKRSHYIAARRAFLLEQSQKEPQSEEHFEKEIAKVSRLNITLLVLLIVYVNELIFKLMCSSLMLKSQFRDWQWTNWTGCATQSDQFLLFSFKEIPWKKKSVKILFHFRGNIWWVIMINLPPLSISVNFLSNCIMCVGI